MKNLPNFLIIGPPKCASTSLHYYLGQHPDVYVSEVKETNFFSHDYHKGLSWYSKYFSDAGSAKAIGEATPSYFFLPFAMDRIKNDLPGVKLIVTLRNPADRAFSHWLMFKEFGVEKASFKKAIDINLKQMEYVDFAAANGPDLWDNRKKSNSDSNKWIRIYIQASMYAEHLNALYKKFGNENVYVVFLEDLKNCFGETIKDLFKFIGVDESFTVSNTEAKNFYFDKKYFRLLQKVVGFNKARYISASVPDNLKRFFRPKKNAVINIPEMSLQERIFLEDFFTNDIKQLEKITGKNLDHWLTHSKQAATIVK
jgi:hypothetical protein